MNFAPNRFDARTWANNAANPILLGPFMGQQVSGVKCYAPAIVPLDDDGYATCFSDKASDTWSNVAMDFDLFYLRGM